ncbi:MAG: hypothetical protein H7841_12905 [Magnetospirillum sp. WYHS-4]
MQFVLAAIHEVTKFVGLLFIAQALVRVLSFGRHEGNVIYRSLRFLTSPVVRLTRAITPRIVDDGHVPVVAFLLIFWAWVALIFIRRDLMIEGAG